jgi:ankyrin repeat protein
LTNQNHRKSGHETGRPQHGPKGTPGAGDREALHLAAGAGQLGVVDLLLDFWRRAPHSHIPITDKKASTRRPSRAIRDLRALPAAAASGHLRVVDILLATRSASAVPYFDYDIDIALHAAARSGQLAVVELLLAAGADVNAVRSSDNDVDGHHGQLTALQTAARHGHLAVVRRLLLAGLAVNADLALEDGRIALQAAVESGHLLMVELLVLPESGVDVNAHPARDRGFTALQAGAGRGHLAVVERLLAAGANVKRIQPPTMDEQPCRRLREPVM